MIGVGAAYCRNVPRPDARLSTKIMSATDPGYAELRVVQEAPPEFAEMGPDGAALAVQFQRCGFGPEAGALGTSPFPHARTLGKTCSWPGP